MPRDVWNKELQCYVRGLRYDAVRREGMLCMGEDACCDMTGCIALFRRIDPDVTFISTWAGRTPDTAYQLLEGEWEALDVVEIPLDRILN